MERLTSAVALLVAIVVWVFGQHIIRLRNQADRYRTLLEDYLQDRTNLLFVLTGLAKQLSNPEVLTKTTILQSIEWWFENDLLTDYYADIEQGGGTIRGIKSPRKPLRKRWITDPRSQIRNSGNRLKATLSYQSYVQLIDMVFHTPNDDIASMVIARAAQEGFIKERLIAADVPFRARIEYLWTSNVVTTPTE